MEKFFCIVLREHIGQQGAGRLAAAHKGILRNPQDAGNLKDIR
jgi:hypothetical protein